MSHVGHAAPCFTPRRWRSTTPRFQAAPYWVFSLLSNRIKDIFRLELAERGLEKSGVAAWLRTWLRYGTRTRRTTDAHSRPLQFGQLAEVPAELEWLANITNPKTRRAYK